ncbi:MAG: Fe-S protein assembly co-chaperone HscB [Gammaproteobacteria bacterium]|nr:Fe-S protein assembly co-chaperone HscB [Gammaproteobacteria bacterium]
MSNSARNFFEIFDLTPGFAIDLALLTGRYRELQRQVHPDKYAQGSDQERRLAVQMAANINDAFRTLKDPVERASYLLHLHEISVDDQSARRLDPEFLLEQMELREALGEVRNNRQAVHELTKIFTTIDTLEQQTLGTLAEAFARGDAASLRTANENVQKLRFINKLRAEAEEVEVQISS